mgnify:CR=1 FL=1
MQTHRFIKHVTETCSFQTTYLCKCESKLRSLYLPSSFTYVDVGAEGRISDGGVFRQSRLYENIQNGSLQHPNDDDGLIMKVKKRYHQQENLSLCQSNFTDSDMSA